jgi:putative ABC transport system permease protein
MKYFHLVVAALLRRKTRTIFTLLSVLAAFLLLGLLNAIGDAFAGAANSVAGASRLVTISKQSITVPLPESLYTRIQAVPGVAAVSHVNWFGGTYQDPRNFFVSEAVAENFFDLYPELVLPASERRAFAATRTGAVVGASLAQRFHWKLGDAIPLQATIFPQKDGSNTWTFRLAGIYHAGNAREKSRENALYFHWEYFDEAAAFGGGEVGWYVEKVAQPRQADRIARAIDAISANSDHETRTQSEAAFITSFASQFADIGLIVASIMGAVFFTVVLLTGNTMAQAVRERIPELAILKTIGFTGRGVLSLVLAESVLLLVLGGAAGLALAGAVVGMMRTTLGEQIPILPVGPGIWMRGLLMMLLVGLLVGALPARRGMALRIADALSDR